jgi:hypothetical protein
MFLVDSPYKTKGLVRARGAATPDLDGRANLIAPMQRTCPRASGAKRVGRVSRLLCRFGLFDRNDLSAFVKTAVGTNAMRYIQVMAVRAFRQILRFECQMTAAAITASFR